MRAARLLRLPAAREQTKGVYLVSQETRPSVCRELITTPWRFRNMKSNKNEKGFSLVELLVVVIIIAIVAAIAIPNLLASRRAANEASAVSSLRTYHSAESTYQATAGGSVEYADGSGLTGLVDGVLADDAAQKSGYTFSVLRGADPFDTYCGTATPNSPSTGRRAYAVGIDGVIYQSPLGDDTTTAVTPTCALGVVDDTTGTPLGGL